jgi:hypothetical protein
MDNPKIAEVRQAPSLEQVFDEFRVVMDDGATLVAVRTSSRFYVRHHPSIPNATARVIYYALAELAYAAQEARDAAV